MKNSWRKGFPLPDSAPPGSPSTSRDFPPRLSILQLSSGRIFRILSVRYYVSVIMDRVFSLDLSCHSSSCGIIPTLTADAVIASGCLTDSYVPTLCVNVC